MKRNLISLFSGLFLYMIPVSAFAVTEVIWWDFLGGGDGVRMKKLIDNFNSSHDDIQINATTLEWGVPFYTKVQTSAAIGEQPDMMTYHLSRFPLAVPTGVLRPISEAELASVGISGDRFFPANWEAANFGGATHGVPLDIHANVMYFNAGMLAEAGLLDENGDPTLLDGIDNFMAGLEKLDAMVEYPIGFASGNGGMVWRWWYSILRMMDGEYLVDGKVCPGDKCEKATQVLADLVERGYMPSETDYGSAKAMFASGQSAIHINGVWEVPTWVDLRANNELGFKFGVRDMPQLFETEASWADSHAFAIPHSDKNPISDEKLNAVLTVISWMSDNSLYWATAGHIPSNKNVVNSVFYNNMEPNAAYANIGSNMVTEPFSPLTGVASPTYDAMQNYIMPAVNGQLSSEEAVQMLRDDLESLM
jgi:multiple sugar transport system substrate-binding protein